MLGVGEGGQDDDHPQVWPGHVRPGQLEVDLARQRHRPEILVEHQEQVLGLLDGVTHPCHHRELGALERRAGAGVAPRDGPPHLDGRRGARRRGRRFGVGQVDDRLVHERGRRREDDLATERVARVRQVVQVRGVPPALGELLLQGPDDRSPELEVLVVPDLVRDAVDGLGGDALVRRVAGREVRLLRVAGARQPAERHVDGRGVSWPGRAGRPARDGPGRLPVALEERRAGGRRDAGRGVAAGERQVDAAAERDVVVAQATDDDGLLVMRAGDGAFGRSGIERDDPEGLAPAKPGRLGGHGAGHEVVILDVGGPGARLLELRGKPDHDPDAHAGLHQPEDEAQGRLVGGNGLGRVPRGRPVGQVALGVEAPARQVHVALLPCRQHGRPCVGDGALERLADLGHGGEAADERGDLALQVPRIVVARSRRDRGPVTPRAPVAAHGVELQEPLRGVGQGTSPPSLWCRRRSGTGRTPRPPRGQYALPGRVPISGTFQISVAGRSMRGSGRSQPGAGDDGAHVVVRYGAGATIAGVVRPGLRIVAETVRWPSVSAAYVNVTTGPAIVIVTVMGSPRSPSAPAG